MIIRNVIEISVNEDEIRIIVEGLTQAIFIKEDRNEIIIHDDSTIQIETIPEAEK